MHEGDVMKMIKLNRCLLKQATLLMCASLLALAVNAQAAGEKKVLRYAFIIAETGFDPAQISDTYSRDVTRHIFEAPLQFDYLAMPAKLRPRVSDGMPVVTDNFKTWTVKIRPGIYFADDPAFKGKKRELTAQDFVYSYKRHYDPVWKSPNLYLLESAKVIGMSELRKAAQVPGAKFDYDREVQGIKALDRYSFQFNFAEPQPRFDMVVLYEGSAFGAVAREVVEFYGDKMMEHPVGTGPYRIAEWRRSSKIVLEKNPNYREEFYEAMPDPSDARAQAIYQQMKGRKIPIIDRVEIAIIEEPQPRWLAFLNGEHDYLERLPNNFANIAIPNNQLAPNLVKKGITMDRVPLLDVTMSYFNMDDPLVGGYTPEKVALRRAISLGYSAELEIRGPRRNQAVFANGSISPGTFGFDNTFKTELSDYDPERAMALLDMYGYTDKNGDGWRDMPDGSPLVIEYATQPDATSRELIEIWQKCMDRIKVKMIFKTAKWPEQLKAARAGKLMMWGVAWLTSTPDGDTFLSLLYSPNKGQSNHSRFKLAEYDALYEKQRIMPSSEERFALMKQAEKLGVAYMPVRFSTHRIATDMMQPWLVGYKRNPFMREFWSYVDIDVSKLPKK
jgi:ABC-type transport system substrate-binding protein